MRVSGIDLILTSTAMWSFWTPERIAAVVLAPFIGSFLGVLILHLPEGRPVLIDRSRCDRCDAVLGPCDLIPLLSFAILRGRCRHCGGKVARFHPAVELAAVAVALGAALASPSETLWADCIFGWLLLALAWIDWRTHLLPDVLTLPLIMIGLAQAWWARDDLTDSLIGAAVGYLIVWSLSLGYRWLRGRDGIGLGDAKVLAAAGAWVGWEGLPLILLGASLSALAAAGVARALGHQLRADTKIPFGPFLAAAIWGVRLMVEIEGAVGQNSS
jgi:leader peptidase (prepilin peptidase)/N-methyltransferase